MDILYYGYKRLCLPSLSTSQTLTPNPAPSSKPNKDAVLHPSPAGPGGRPALGREGDEVQGVH